MMGRVKSTSVGSYYGKVMGFTVDGRWRWGCIRRGGVVQANTCTFLRETMHTDVHMLGVLTAVNEHVRVKGIVLE